MAERNHSYRISRRTFLANVAFVPASLLLLPITPKDKVQLAPVAPNKGAQPGTPRRQIVIQVLNDAVMTKNMSGAIEKYGKSLTPEEKGILLSLSPAELAALQSARGKLKMRASP
jgi:hypothetical protein